MIIHFIAPFETGFNLHSYQPLSDTINYREFWDKVDRDTMSDNPDIEFLHSYDNKTKHKFKTITKDSNSLSFELLIVRDKDLKSFFIHALEQLKQSGKYRRLTEHIVYIESSCKIYDNNIGVIEFNFEVPYSETDIVPLFEEIQEFSNELMENALKRVYTGLLASLFSKIKLLDNSKKYIYSFQTKAEEDVCPLWVNRSIFITERSESTIKILAERWLNISTDKLKEGITDLLTDGIYLGWGHNIFLLERNSIKTIKAIEALHMCQYYNAVFEILNNELSNIIGETFLYDKVNHKTKLLNRRLNEILSNTKLLLLQLNDTQFNLQGYKQYYFLDLFEKWHLEKLKGNLENKMEFCKGKIEEIYQHQTKRNQVITEIILFGIGGIALVDFFSNISQFAFTILTSVNNIKYKYINIPGILDIANMVSPNGMIWSGFALLFVIFVLYSLFSSRSR